MDVKDSPRGKVDRTATLRVAACMVVSFSEGFDLASGALAGPTIIADFALNRAQFGLIATSLMTGFLIGAWGGGLLGDRHGRRRFMLLSMGLIALSSLVTTQLETFQPLLAARFITGLGLGGVMPNMLALAAGSVPPAARGRAVTLANCGGSVGAICAGLLLAVAGAAVTWRAFFMIAAFMPLAIIPFAWAILPESKASDAGARGPGQGASALFGRGQTKVTLLLWLASFLTSAVYYGFSSWTPILLGQRGLSPKEIGGSAMMLSLSAIFGALLFATLFDRGRRRLSVLLAYGGMVLALPAFALAPSAVSAIGSVALVGFTVFGGQLLLYAVVAASYAPANRSTALGTSVAAGRFGGLLSPMVMGLLLEQAMGPRGVVLVLIPLVLLAAAAAFWVARREPVGSGG